jgi:hypothetical protein
LAEPSSSKDDDPHDVARFPTSFWLLYQKRQHNFFSDLHFQDILRGMACSVRRSISIGVLILTMAANCFGQRGALTVPQALDQMAQEAEVIFRGVVTSTNVEPHPQLANLMTVVVSMNISEVVKGSPRKSLVFRQYVWDLRDQVDTGQYRKGQELLLLLRPVSEYGLTSPVGLEQGRFRILRDAKGEATVLNGRGNLGLFQSVEARAQARGITLSPRVTAMVRRPQAGAVPLADPVEAIHSLEVSK